MGSYQQLPHKEGSKHLSTKMVALGKLPNCCACISLKTGTLIIGSLSLVGSVILTLASIGFIASQQWVIDMVDQTGSQGLEPSQIFLFAVIMLVASILSILTCAALIHGARTRNVCLMGPYIISTGISLFLNIGNIIRAIASASSFPDIAFSIFCWLLSAYFFLVVWSYKKEITEGASGEEVQKA